MQESILFIQGILTESELIQWSEISDSVIHVIPGQYLNSEYLILNLIGGTEKKIELTFLDGNPKRIGGTFEYFRKQAKRGI